jgi:hypothetical protein
MVPNLDHEDHQTAILDGVEDAVVTDTDTPSVCLALQFGDTRRSWTLSEGLDLGHHPTLYGLVQRRQLALRTGGKQNGITHDL